MKVHIIPYFLTGTAVSYEYFKDGEPNGSNEHCIEIYSDDKWNDENCSDKLDFICQFEADAPYEFEEELSKYCTRAYFF